MTYTLITGASAGIGRAMADKFASQNHNLILVARRTDKLEAITAEIEASHGVDVLTRGVDLTDEAQVLNLYNGLREHDISVLINNAGLGDYSYSWDMNIDKALAMIDLNVRSLMLLSVKYVQDYADRDATLMNVSSGGGYFVLSKAVTYCATKFFVSSFTEGIAQNLRAQGKRMRAKVLAPGATTTEFVANADRDAGFKGADIFDPSIFISAEQVAEYAYRLYGSDAILGLVNHKNELDLKDPVFPYGG